MNVLNLGLYYRSWKYQSEWSKLCISTDEKHVYHEVFHFPASGLA